MQGGFYWCYATITLLFMIHGNDETNLDNLKSRLYRPNGEGRSVRRLRLEATGNESPSGWGERATDSAATPKRRRSFLVRLLVVSGLFFVLALGFAVYVFSRGLPFISPANVFLTLTGPNEVAAGETLSLEIKIKNGNDTPLESVQLLLEYPPGTRVADNVEKELRRERIAIGQILPGGEARQVARSAIFGEKGNTQIVRASLEYRLKDSNAIFSKGAKHEVIIATVPINLALVLPKETNSNEQIILTIQVSSNAQATLKNLMVLAAYPPGFTYQSANPPPSVSKAGWLIGDMPVGAKREITIRGVLAGNNDETKTFRATIGTPNPDDDRQIGVTYNSVVELVNILRPHVDLTFTINGDATPDYAAAFDQKLRADVEWVNNLTTPLSDGEIEIELVGDVLQPTAVNATDGFYQSSLKRIVWNKTTRPALAEITPNTPGRVSFDFGILPLAALRDQIPHNPVIDLKLVFRAKRSGGGVVNELFEIKTTKTIKLNSSLQLSSNIFYHGGPLPNQGSLPPKVGVPTTYTVVWSVVNSSNEVDGATVKATLPSYVRWLGRFKPEDERVTFNENGGEVVWELGSVPAGRGFLNSARELAFQIEFLPSLSQVSDAPALISGPILRGTDLFTHRELESVRRPLSTAVGDANFRAGDDKVIP